MAGSLNKVILIGHVGANPEVMTLSSGNVVANFSLATTETWKDRSTGEKKERTEWHRCVVWNEGLCGVVEQYVRKGQKLYVEGQLQTRKWEKDGVERYSTEVVLTGFDAKLLMLDRGGGGNRDQNDNASRPGNGGRAKEGGNAYANAKGKTQQPASVNHGLDDEIPF
jgi:single-strand DNA-binding protein